jgi:hypothetical protein
MQNTKLEIISGDIKKGDRKGQKWEALRITIGEWQKVIFVGNDSPIKTQFEFRYIKQQLEDE